VRFVDLVSNSNTMNTVLFDGPDRNALLPLTYTRPVGLLRIGILTLAEKWERELGSVPQFLTQSYLQAAFPFEPGGVHRYILGGLCPNPGLVEAIAELESEQSLWSGTHLLAFVSGMEWDGISPLPETERIEFEASFHCIRRPWDLFKLNAAELEADFERITAGRQSAPISSTNTVLGNRIFAEPGAVAEASVFNTLTGPIYLGVDTEVMEGCLVRGGMALCDHAQLKMGAKVYGASTIGPHSRVGGELSNSILTGYSNKGHDGFLGNSVLGEWCNLGADTNNSNLKNNYDEVKLWNYERRGFERTGLQFCGLIMGDHSKSGINTMFNTGTVVGVSANVFGSGFPRNFIPSFSWGGAQGFTEYALDKALATAARVTERRSIELDDIDRAILHAVFEQSAEFRSAY